MNEHAESCPCKACNPEGKGDPEAALAAKRAALANPQTPSTEDRRRFALPPGARGERFQRFFSEGQKSLLRGAYCLSDRQIECLSVALRVIAYYTQAAPELREVRKPLSDLAKSAHKTVQGMEALLQAPAHEDARVEARDRIGQAVFALYPERCQPDPTKASPFHRHDERMEEVMRMARELEAVATRALVGIPANVTKARASAYPIACINDALAALDGETVVTPRIYDNSPFREIVRICYEAAGAATTDPETAIRAYLKSLKASEDSC